MDQRSGGPLAHVAVGQMRQNLTQLPQCLALRELAAALGLSYTRKMEEKGGEEEFSSLRASKHTNNCLDPGFRAWALTPAVSGHSLKFL